MQQQTQPVIATEHLLLRQLQLTDDNAIFALRNNEQVNAFIQRLLLNNINDARDFITAINEGIEHKEWLYWGMVSKHNQQLIGTICFWHFSRGNTMAETGYELHPYYQGKGLMSEALQSVINYGFTVLQLQAIEAYTQPGNVKSVQLLMNNNFIQDSTNTYSEFDREIRFVLQKPAS